MSRIPFERYVGQVPVPTAFYRSSLASPFAGGSFGPESFGVAFYSALAVMQGKYDANKTRVDQLVAVAESAASPDAVLEALNGSAQERTTLLAENASLEPQISAERARREQARNQPAIAVDEVALAAQVAAGHAADEPKAPKPFRSLGEQLQAVAGAALHKERAPDPRLVAIQEFAHTQAAAAGGNELVGSEGGFFVQTDFSTDLLGAVFSAAQLAPLAENREIGAGFNGVKFNVIDETSRATGSRYGGVRAYWFAEVGAVTISKSKSYQEEITLQKLGGL